MNKNILFYNPTPIEPEKGGVERVSFILSEFFIEQGYNVFYLHLPSKFDYSEYPLDVKPLFLPDTYLISPRNIEYYNRIVEMYNIDVIIDQFAQFGGSYLIGTLKNKRKVRVISVIHNNPIREYDYIWNLAVKLKNDQLVEKIKRIARIILYPLTKYRMRKSILNYFKYLYNHTDIICLLSKEFLPILKRIDRNLLEKAYVINNPNTYSNNICMPSKENIVLYVGRLQNRQKNLKELISIWKKVYNDNWKFIILGDGPDRKYLENLSKGYNNIIFEGFKDPKPYYQKAKILCLTSFYEGWGMVLTEALQFGCVPIAFESFPAVRDIIISGETGELVRPFSEKEYIKKLNHLIEDEDYRYQLSVKGFNHVKKFDISNILPEWIKIIEK